MPDAQKHPSPLHIPAIDVIYALYVQRSSSILTIQRDGILLKLTFDRGRIVNLWSNFVPGLSLGEYLVEQGQITPEDRSNAFEISTEQHIQFGVVLLQQQKVSPHQLFEGIQILARRKLDRIMGWESAIYHLEHLKAIPANQVILSVPMPHLIFRGLKESRRAEQLSEEFGRRMHQPLVQSRSKAFTVEELGLSAEEQKIWALLHHPRTIPQILEGVKIPIESLFRVLFALLSMNLAAFELRKQTGTIEFFDIIAPYIIDELDAASAFISAEELVATAASESETGPHGPLDDFQILKATLARIVNDDTFFENWAIEPAQSPHTKPEVIPLKSEAEMIDELRQHDYEKTGEIIRPKK
ncbi:MAG: hypothetical protein D6795_09695 [Deltaproteobacteria bacterium]|nr:MAG: hypothetical protein D6795_09695 [Deltaproteobacteria bacterium]